MWKTELPVAFKNREITCKMDSKYIGLLLKDDGKDKCDKVLYVYETMTHRYLGFINLSELLDRPSNNVALDFVFPKNQQKGGLIIFCRDVVYLLAQDPRKSDSGKWTVVHKFNKIFRLEADEIVKVDAFETPFSRIAFIVNNKYTIIKNKLTVRPVLVQPGES